VTMSVTSSILIALAIIIRQAAKGQTRHRR
jgi:hypothetical protein